MDRVRALGLIRIGMGAGLIVFPEQVSRRWVGRAPEPSAWVYSAALGIREVLLGAAASTAAPGSRRPLLLAGAVADAVDFGASAVARRRGRAAGTRSGLVLPGLAAFAGFALAARERPVVPPRRRATRATRR